MTQQGISLAPSGRSLASLFNWRDLASIGGLSKPWANWVRLFLLAGAVTQEPDSARLRALRGFPPPPGSEVCVPTTFVLWTSTRPPNRAKARVHSASLVSCSSVLALPKPRDAKDRARLLHRVSYLQTGRPVQAPTRTNRGWIAAAFSQWLEEVRGFTLEALLEGNLSTRRTSVTGWCSAGGTSTARLPLVCTGDGRARRGASPSGGAPCDVTWSSPPMPSGLRLLVCCGLKSQRRDHGRRDANQQSLSLLT